MNTKKVTCQAVSKGTVLICSPGTEDADHNYTPREQVPMTVAVIVCKVAGLRGRVRTYLYYTADGTFITYAGGATLVVKVVR
jgi:hypothetical protein